MSKLKQVTIGDEKLFYTLSFDIDDFIGAGVWWLQIYDNNQNLFYDKPFASSIGKIEKKNIMKIIKEEFLSHRGEIL